MGVRILAKRIVVLSPEHAPVMLGSPDQRKFSEGRARRSILRILRANVLCSMATVTKKNRAHINHAYFCYSPDLEVYFLSDPSSLHCRNLETNSSMAITIFNSSQKWGGSDRGMQLFGTCREARGRQASKAEHSYAKRFRSYGKWRASLSQDERRLFRYRFYHFVPTQVKILDEREFGVGAFVIAALKRT